MERKTEESKSNFQIKKGDIFIANLSNCNNPSFNGKKKVVIVQKEDPSVDSIIIAMILSEEFSSGNNDETEIKLDSDIYDLGKDNIIFIDQMRVIDKASLGELIGKLNEDDLNRLNEGLLFEFGFR